LILLQYTVSLVFIVSGLVKLNDPIGFAWTLEAYFRTLAVDFTPLFLYFIPVCLILAMAIATVELILGVALLVSFKQQLTLLALLTLTVFFTCLTFYTAFWKRMGSCGCFGDAIPLTPWQSFIKSMGLLIALDSLYKNLQRHASNKASKMQLGYIFLAGVLGIGISIYAWQQLPIFDFSLFKKGSNLLQHTQPSAPLRYQYKLEKEGQYIESTDAPTHPTDRIVGSKLLNPSAKPRITNFTIWNEKGEITNQILQGTQLLIIAQAPSQMLPEAYALLKQTLQTLPQELQLTWLIPFYETQAAIPTELITAIGWTSPDLLKAMLKSQLGFILLQDGIILEKGTLRTLERVKKRLR
ncbi:MAG: MauE/DoxX family redox-associated membrane protein, partial [Burkholderiales bacterium]